MSLLTFSPVLFSRMQLVKMKLHMITTLGLLLVGSFATAAPSVSDNTISWPDDGWYQVQQVTDDGAVEVCAGGRSCEVSQGEYIVINHSTGERFTDIIVANDVGESSTESVTVTNNTISWPSAGWYQVLNSSTYAEICNGTRSCDVLPGSYIVINHTTGERFENIVVGEPTNQESSITVTANTISWTNDGWYQVQSAQTFASICDGGTSCIVPNGEYIVINHNTGRRWDNVIVGEQSSAVTRVDFDITVPAYVSNALQVRLIWGDIDTAAIWNSDELWTVSADFPVNTTNQLVVTFSDNNGAITLGSFETSFITGANLSESFQIAADEFDTDRWDSDGDGVSNLSELIAGANPLGGETLEPVQANLELVVDKTFRITWQLSTGAQFYRVLENPDGLSGFTDISGELDATTTSFNHRVALYKRLNSRYMVEACNASACASSDELLLEGTLASGVGIISASNIEAGDGATGVTISADGNTMAFGALGEDSAATGINGDQQDNSSSLSGAVYVFKRQDGSWQQQAYIKASNSDPDDRFGRELSLNGDGTILAVGVEEESSAASGINGEQLDNSLQSAGAVYVFTLADGSWQQQAYIKASNPTEFARFGSRVDLSAEGNTLAVLARGDSTATFGINGDQSAEQSSSYGGAVYVFERTNNEWQQQAFIKPDSVRFGGAFAYRFIGLSENGNTLAIARYVFSRIGGVWQQDVYFDPTVIGAHPSFGKHGALSDDGKTLVISAPSDINSAMGVNPPDAFSIDTRKYVEAGAVHVFGLVNGSWAQQAYLKPSVTQSYTTFGTTVSVSADGDTLAVYSRDVTDGTGIFNSHTSISAPTDPVIWPNDTAAVYIYRREFGIWRQSAYVKPPLSLFRLGSSIALDGKGDTLVINNYLRYYLGRDLEDLQDPAASAVYIY